MASETLIRDDDYDWTLSFFDENGDPYDLTGCLLRFTVKPAGSDDPEDDDALVKHYIQISGAGAVTQSRGLALDTDAEAGDLIQTLLAEDKAALASAGGTWDLEIVTATGKRYTLLFGDFAVTRDITRRSEVT